MERRQFIKRVGVAGAGVIAAPYILTAKKTGIVSMSSLDFLSNDNILIIIDLFGGNDGLNTVIPLEDDNYYNFRPNVGIAKSDAIRWGLSSTYLHPALVHEVINDGFWGLLDTGRLAIIQNVGYQAPTLSHFRSSDIWSSGINNKDPKFKLLEGWLGRYFESKMPNFPEILPEHPLGIAIGGQVPLIFKSKKGHFGIAFNSAERFAEMGRNLAPLVPQKQGNDFNSQEFNFIHQIATQSEIYSKAVGEAYNKGINTIEYSGGLSQRFKTIAKLISGGMKSKVYYTRLSNFDSHAQQMANPFEGQHPQLLAQLSRAISEFMYDATEQGFADRIAGMTTSEFGRRVHDNGSRGTDHGTANVMFAFGDYNYLEGGVYGENPDLANLVDGNLNHEFDFRRVYTTFLESWFGANSSDVRDVFGEPFLPIPFLKQRISSVNSPFVSNHGEAINVFPNPSSGNFNFSFEMKKTTNVVIEIFSIEGIKILGIDNSLINSGLHEYKFNLTTKGNYIISILANGYRSVAKITVI